MDYRLEPNDLNVIYDWMDGKNTNGSVSDASARLFRLCDALRNRLLKDRLEARQENARLLKRIERLTGSDNDEEIRIPRLEEAGHDSGDLTKIIMYVAYQTGLRFTKDRAIHILYLLYASRLARNAERLTIEHPVANTRGPQFWHASNSFGKYPTQEEGRRLTEKLKAADTGLYVHIVNAVKKYGPYPCRENNDPLAKILLESKPFLNASPKNNDGKWNGEIKDEDIYRWRVKMKGLL